MISLKKSKTDRPKKKWNDKCDGSYRVFKVFNGTVIVELPDGQSVINSLENRDVADRVAERGDDGNNLDKWEF